MGWSHGSPSACGSPRRGRPQRSPAGAGIPVVYPVQPVVQERSSLTDIQILLQSMLPVGSVAEKNVRPPEDRQEPTADSSTGVFRVGSRVM